MSLDWWEQPIVVLDTETTGVDAWHDRLVTASMVIVDQAGAIVRVKEWMARVDHIPGSATEIHGITTAQSHAEGRPIAEVVPEIVATLESCRAKGFPVGIMNAPFDWTLMHAELSRLGGGLLPTCMIIDPHCLDRHCDKWRKGKRTLTALAEHYAVKRGKQHDATNDARATADVIRMMTYRHPMLRQLSLVELQVYQIKWYAAWSSHMTEYFAKTGRVEADGSAIWMNPGWPLQYDSQALDLFANV